MNLKARLRQLWLFCHTPEGVKLLRYGAVSVVSALVAFSTLTLVYGVLRLWSEVPSAFFSNIVAGLVNYFLNRKWVWGRSGRSSLRREILPFWIMSIAGIVLALFTASFARSFSDAHQLNHLMRTIVILSANSLAFGTIWVVKFLVLNRIFRPAPDAMSMQPEPGLASPLEQEVP